MKSAEILPPENPRSGPAPDKSEGVLGRLKDSKLGKAARAFALVSALAGTAEPVMANTSETVQENTDQKIQPGNESEWLDYARKRPAEAISRLKFREDIPIEERTRIIEAAIDADPIAGLDIHQYEYLPDAEKLKLLKRALRGALDMPERPAADGGKNIKGVNAILELGVFFLHLEGVAGYFKEAVERADDKPVLEYADLIFEHLPRDSAESAVRRALRGLIDQDPLTAIAAAPRVREYLEDYDMIVEQALKQYMSQEFQVRYLSIILDALPEGRKISFLDEVIRDNPFELYGELETHKNPSDSAPSGPLGEILKKSQSPETLALLRIMEAPDIDPQTKRKLPLLLDEFISNKKFTLKEASIIVNDPDKLVEFLGKITQREDYAGKASIARFLSSPVTNRVFKEKE